MRGTFDKRKIKGDVAIIFYWISRTVRSRVAIIRGGVYIPWAILAARNYGRIIGIKSLVSDYLSQELADLFEITIE